MFKRRIYPQLKAHLSARQITVLTGMRRTGKTTLLKQLLSDIESSNKIYIDLQQLENREIFSAHNYDAILERFKEKGLSLSLRAYVAIDEIQMVKEIPGILKYLYDHYDIKFLVTGSSSYYLKNLFTESMAGRKHVIELFPLDFGEFLVFKGVTKAWGENFFDFKSNISLPEYGHLSAYYEEFIRFGGFPEVVLADTEQRKRDILNEILSSYVNIDVSSLADFAKRDGVYALARLLAARVGGKVDYSKLSRLSGLSRPAVKNYLDLLEGTYLISRIPILSGSVDRELVKAKKLYMCDSGLLGILADTDSGTKFENSVYAQLRQLGEIQYYSLKSGREIDFILNGKTAFEVKETPIKNDLRNLAKLAEKAGIKEYRLIGKNQSPKFDDYIWGGSIR